MVFLHNKSERQKVNFPGTYKVHRNLTGVVIEEKKQDNNSDGDEIKSGRNGVCMH